MYNETATEREEIIRIPRGFKVIDVDKHYSREKAREILSSKKQRRYTEGYIVNDEIKLKQRLIVCPFCRSYIPMTNWYFKEEGVMTQKVDNDEIKEWLSDQLSFIEDSYRRFSAPVPTPAKIKCNKCKQISSESNEEELILITREKDKISIKKEISINELLSVKWIDDFAINSFATNVELSFDIKDGTITKTVFDGNRIIGCQKVYCSDDIDEVFLQLLCIKHVYRRIKGFMKTFWDNDNDLNWTNPTIDELIIRTFFAGYSKGFYEAIPYDSGYKIDKSFREISDKLHNRENIPSLINESKLPHIKSVRGTIFNRPEYLFYLKEIESFWGLFGNDSVFNSFLKLENVFLLLDSVHRMPMLITFFEDYKKEKGIIGILRYLRKDWEIFLEYGKSFMLLNDDLKDEERKKWKGKYIKKANFSIFGNVHPNYRVPIGCNNKSIKEKAVQDTGDGFCYVLLNSIVEYRRAGGILHNCLKDHGRFGYYNSDGDIIGVYKKNKLVATIEVVDGIISQASTDHNDKLSTCPGLEKSFYKWVNNNNFRVDL